jgi:hypothetical protein
MRRFNRKDDHQRPQTTLSSALQWDSDIAAASRTLHPLGRDPFKTTIAALKTYLRTSSLPRCPHLPLQTPEDSPPAWELTLDPSMFPARQRLSGREVLLYRMPEPLFSTRGFWYFEIVESVACESR